MIHTAYTVRMLRVVALVLGLALLLWSTSFPGLLFQANAESVTSASDTISVSAPSQSANHTIQFTTGNGLAGGDTMILTFNGGFDIPSGFDFNDIDITDDGGEITLAGTAGGGSWGVATTSTTITFDTTGAATVASSSVIVIEIGTNATEGATGDTQITNPGATGSHGIDITGTMPDSGQVRVAIVDEVTVTASVDTSLTFTVNGVANALGVNGTTTTQTSTATAIPFGTLSDGVVETLAQDITVATNATNGFIVTLEQSGNLQNPVGDDIDGFIDGAYTDSPSAWTAPAGTPGLEDTYGHWGLTSEDSDLNADEFGSDLWISASTTPRTIFSHNGVSNGVTVDEGSTRIGFQAEISALQEASTEYSTELRYIATPTF